MRVETFHEEHDTPLTEEERNIRGRQAARQSIALTKHDELFETLAEDWRTRKKQLAGDRELMVDSIRKVATAAETGKEPRLVECREELVGVMVITIRCDTGETVGSRAATRQEMAPVERAKNEALKHDDPEDFFVRVQTQIAMHCRKARTESALLKALEKDLPNATLKELKAEVTRQIELGRLVEDGGKLTWIGGSGAAPAEDDGVVDDDYQPAAH